jgi:hypothetical protein
MSPVLYGQHFHTARLLVETAPADLRVVTVQQPQFRDEGGFDFPSVEYADHAALRDDDSDGASRCEIDAAARCRLPSPSGRSIRSTEASR